ncbi:MAG: ECF family RNA polymerase sigma factor SbrI [Wenzhouxiangellaceae bacterium]
MANKQQADPTLAEQDLLVLAAQSGNRRAFAALFKLHHRSLLRFATKFSRDPELARDAVQDAWLGMTRALPGLHDPRAFRSWLYRRVRWRLLDAMRASQREPLQAAADDSAGNATDAEDNTQRRQQQQTEDHNQLQYALAQLPLIDRQAIELFYLQQLQINEIAIVLEIPTGTVKSRLNRARKQLRALLAGG